MTVVDAGVLLTALVDDGADGAWVRERLTEERLQAPELIDLEVLSALRGLVRSGQVSAARAAAAVEELPLWPVDRLPHRPFVARCWELRHNVTPYDAVYVAVAEVFDELLVTADARLASSSGPTCRFEVLSRPVR